MLKSRVLRTKEELAQASAEWDQVFRNSCFRSFFLSWDWVSTWAQVYLENDQLRCILLYDDHEPVAIAPLWLDRIRLLGVFPIRVLKFIGSDELCSDHLDFLIPGRSQSQLSRALWNEVFDTIGHEWDLWEYHQVPVQSPNLDEFLLIASEDYRCTSTRIDGYSICPYLRLPARWEELVSRLSANQRRALRLAIDRIEKISELRLSFCRSLDNIETQMSTLIELNRRAWASRGQTGSFSTSRFESFHRLLARKLLPKENLCLCSLWAGDKLLGSFYGFDFDGVRYYYVIGVDREAVPNVNIGRVLLAKCMEDAIAKDLTTFDFLRGRERYKYDWTKTDQRNMVITFSNRTFGALVHDAYSVVRGLAKQFLMSMLRTKWQPLRNRIRGENPATGSHANPP